MKMQNQIHTDTDESQSMDVGDIIWLNSGGPAMKIIEFVPMIIRAEWDKGDGSKGREFFYPETVTKDGPRDVLD
jgi:uncharacterized protein YodC (DUF2158 family)